MSRYLVEETEESSEERILRTMPEKYASIAAQVNLAMSLTDRPCAGGECDEGETCLRHRRIGSVVSRYLRLKRVGSVGDVA